MRPADIPIRTSCASISAAVVCTAVRIAAIVIKSAAHPDQAPAKVRLFINRPTIGFGDAQDLACTQDLQLDSSTAEGQTIPLK